MVPSYYTLLTLLMVVKQIHSWQYKYDYLLADLEKCSRVQPDVVIWVQGRAANPQRRSIIREIMASDKAWPGDVKALFFFMVGRSNGSDPEEMQIHLNYEFDLYGDIVQNDYIEHYENQTAKMISAINFLADYCSDARIAIRMDDDVIFHPTQMISQVVKLINQHPRRSHYNTTFDYHSLVNYKPLVTAKKEGFSPTALERRKDYSHKPTSSIKLNKGNTIVCHLLKNFPIIRHHMNRPYPVDDSVLPHEQIYPDFCAGFFIAMTSDLLPQLQSLFKVEPPFWIDDSYLGVLQKIIRVGVVNAEKLVAFDPPPGLPLKKIINGGEDRSLIAVHLMQGEKYLHQMIQGKMLSEFQETGA